jgi:hypothetical protein
VCSEVPTLEISNDSPEAAVYSFIEEASVENARSLLKAFQWPAQPFSTEESDLFTDYCRHSVLMRAHQLIAVATKQKRDQDLARHAQDVYSIWLKGWVARVLALLTFDNLIQDQQGNTILHLIADNVYDDDVMARDCLLFLMEMGLSIAEGGHLVAAMLQQANATGHRPLHLAIIHRKFHTAYGLIRAGADVNVPVFGAMQSSSVSFSSSDIVETPIILAIKLIDDVVEKISDQTEVKSLAIGGKSWRLPIHSESPLQFAKNLLNYDAVLPTLTESSELAWRVGLLLASVQAENSTFKERMIAEENRLKLKAKWFAPNEKGPISAKRAAIKSLLNALSTAMVEMSSSNHSMPSISPAIKILRDWMKKYPDYYQALKATTFILDADAFKIIQEILRVIPEHYLQKHTELFNAPDRRSNPASKHARYHPPASGDSIGEMVAQTPEMAYEKFRGKLKEYMAQIGSLQEMLYQKAFELIQSHDQLMLQVELAQGKEQNSWLSFNLSFEESAILAGARWDWALNTREKEDIKRAELSFAPTVGNASLAFSVNNAADEVSETPMMILLHLMEEVQHRESKVSTNHFFDMLECFLNYDAIFPEIPFDSPLILIQEELLRRIRGEREQFLLKIMAEITKLEDKSKWLLSAEKEPIRNKISALTKFLEAYAKSSSNPATPILKIFRDWARDNSQDYLALRKTTFMFDSQTCQLIDELLKAGPVYYRETFKNIFEPVERQPAENSWSGPSTSSASLTPRDKKIRNKLTQFSRSEQDITDGSDEQAKKAKNPPVAANTFNTL